MKKISNRLQTIDNMVNSPYQSIWDCCCDHGLLGITLLKRKAAGTIHFVDIVPSLTTRLESLLQKHFNSDDYVNRWQVHCTDVAKLPLTAQDKHLIIIAGVGGELLIEFIDEIIKKFQINLPKNALAELEFILCPVRYNYQVRQTLISHNCTLLNECLVTENNRFYEIIHVRKQFSVLSNTYTLLNKISPTGDKMWDLSLSSHQQYLAKTISHYQRISHATKDNEQVAINKIIAQYADLASNTKS
jgi:tRNA (adenine22-N1)-methyltransferase